jgi:hypothetical protein
MIKGIMTVVQVLTGFAPRLPEVPEVYKPTAPLDPRKVRNYNEIDFATLVAQGRARCIEWYVVQGIEVGFDHDLEVWCNAPGNFHEVV